MRKLTKGHKDLNSVADNQGTHWSEAETHISSASSHATPSIKKQLWLEPTDQQIDRVGLCHMTQEINFLLGHMTCLASFYSISAAI